MNGRDRQRAAVYAWEDRVVAPADPSRVPFSVADGMVRAIWGELGLRYPPRVEPLPPQSRCVADATRLSIRLAASCPSWCLLHELAHSLSSTHDGQSDGHGPCFMGLYLQLLARYLRLPHAELLASASRAGLAVEADAVPLFVDAAPADRDCRKNGACDWRPTVIRSHTHQTAGHDSAMALKKPASKAAPKKAASPAAKARPPAKPAAASPKAAAAATPATVTLKILAAEFAAQHALAKNQADTMLTDMVGLMVQHLKGGDRLRLGGLGILEVKNRPARTGRNPATGAAIEIKASKKIAFRAAKELKDAI